MRFSKLLTTAGMFATAIASGANIVTAIKRISGSATSLKSAAASWDGSLLSGLAIGASAENLLTNTNAGINVVKTSNQLSETEAAQVAAAMKDLADNIEGTRSTFITAKPKVAGLGILPVVLDNFKKQRTAAHGFAAAVIPKMPVSRQAETLAQIQRMDLVFADVIKAYS